MRVVQEFKALKLTEQHEAFSQITSAYNDAKESRRVELEAEIRSLGFRPGEVAKKPVKVKYRSPTGDTWSGVGALPKWAKQLGVNDKAGMERFKVEIAGPQKAPPEKGPEKIPAGLNPPLLPNNRV